MQKASISGLSALMESLGDLGLKEAKILLFIYEYKQGHDGNSPTLRRIAAHVGLSQTAVHYWVRSLIKRGYLKKVNHKLETGGSWVPSSAFYKTGGK